MLLPVLMQMLDARGGSSKHIVMVVIKIWRDVSPGDQTFTRIPHQIHKSTDGPLSSTFFPIALVRR